ncbi:MAG TPA: hypothetical protein VLA37_13055, partial [Sphingomonadaceae bacterium]|nr:hypothetical protein [Sphingomonadaceae bacterium]
DGRPVLIDFGSARFESGEATSTSVTFHTPPYAAIEQYVRTYDQGPWTDIYALGVVLYQCITGEKPPEVLERMHAGLGKPLAHGNWPGYSRNFLAAVDAAMTVKPTERPQSIPAWLKMFEEGGAPVIAAPPEPEAPEIDEDATRVEAYLPDKAAAEEVPSDQIVPVAPPEPGFSATDDIKTAVPSDPDEVSFKRAGEDTQTKKKEKPKGAAEQEEKVEAKAPPPRKEEPAAGEDEPAQDEVGDTSAKQPAQADEPEEAGEAPPPAKTKPAKKPKEPRKPDDQEAGDKKKLNPLMIGGAAAALAIAAIGGVVVMGGGDDEAAIDESLVEGQAFEPIDIEAAGGIAQALQVFIEEATEARAPAGALKILNDAAEELAGMETQLSQMANDPDRAGEVPAQQERMSGLAQEAAADFAAAILGEADATARRFAAQVPWADPRNAGAAASQPADRQALARQVRTALSGIRTAAAEAREAEDLATALTAAQATLARNNAYNTAMARARRANTTQAQETTASETPVVEAAPAISDTPAPAASPGVSGQASSLWPQKARNFASIVREARGVADDVISLGRGSAPDDDASQDVKDGYRIRQANVQTARNYISYLDTLTNSMRGDRTEAEVDENISNAQETRRYLQQLLASSRAAQR